MRDQFEYFYEWGFVFKMLHLIPNAFSQAAHCNLLRQQRMMILLDTVGEALRWDGLSRLRATPSSFVSVLSEPILNSRHFVVSRKYRSLGY